MESAFLCSTEMVARRKLLVELVAALLLVAGCQRSEPASDLKEYWDAYYLDDSKVGYAHTTYAKTTERGEPLLSITSDSEMTLLRFGQSVKQQLQFSSLEKPDGELIRFDSKMFSNVSGAPAVSIATEGRVENDQLVLQVSTLGKTQTERIPWNKSWGGFFATEQTLERKPMQTGEKRSLRALIPGFNLMADVEFEAAGLERTKVLEGERELLRINTKMKLGDNTIQQTIWTDSAGQTIKSFMPALKQTSYRTTKLRALEDNTGQFDLGQRSIVKLDRKLERPHQTQRVVYHVAFTNDGSSIPFVHGSTQLVRMVDDRTVEVIVRSLRPMDELGKEFPVDEPTTDDDLLPNTLIQSDDDEVTRLARSVASQATDPWEIATSLEQTVKQYVSNKSFSQALGSAADVVRSREGDCTEHAVLLAALCRARQIPARIAIGLVYFRGAEGFAYHMWTEAWVKDRWLPLDATLGLRGIGAAHIKVSHSSLRGVDPLSQFLPVFQLIGNIRVQVISAE